MDWQIKFSQEIYENVEKIKTTGCTYMAATGLNDDTQTVVCTNLVLFT